MQDALNVSLALNQSPHGLLLLAVLERAVVDIKLWFKRHSRRRSDLTIETFNSLLSAAQNADDWLRDCVDSRLKFTDVCAWHGLDPEALRSRIYQQFDATALRQMRLARLQTPERSMDEPAAVI